MPAQPTIQLSNTSLSDISRGLGKNDFTSEHLVKAYLARIKEVNQEYHAVIETNPNALLEARLLDSERRSRGPRGPLHGVAILLKDNIPTLDDTHTTCGSLALIGARPPKEADVVTALRKAGAIILGKANMAEWSGFRSTNGCSGWSARGGQTKGIFYPGSKASGSSSGSAVAVALGLCFAALGTETCYSVVWPAERSGIIGFKPTRNLISSEGLIHASMRLDSVGLLTRNVNDAKQILLEILNQSAHHSPETKLKMIQDIEPSCSSLDLKDIRIGIPWHLAAFASLHEAKFEPFKRVLSILKSAGATFVHDVRITGAQEFEALSSSERTIILDTDMKIAINSYLSSLTTNPARIHNLQDLIAFRKSCPGEEYPSRNVQVFERADATDPLSETYLKMLARDDYFSGEGGIEGALGRHRCSVLIVPTLCVTLQTFAAKAGSPVMSVPMGAYPEGTVVEIVAKNGLVNIAPGIPFSVYIFGRATKDEDVLKVGYVLEQMTRVREKLEPYMAPRTEIADVVAS